MGVEEAGSGVSLKEADGSVRLVRDGDCLAELDKEDFEWISQEAQRRGFVRPSMVRMRLPHLPAREHLKIALWFSQYLGVPLTG